MSYEKDFSIADICLHISATNNPTELFSFSQFSDTRHEKIDWKIELIECHDLLFHNTMRIYDGVEYEVAKFNGGGWGRHFKEVESGNFYALSYLDEEYKRCRVLYESTYQRYFSDMANCFFHSNWEKIMILENRLIMHASCVDTDYGGILFSGPSGIGKSTQSDLWCSYEGAELINGDRPILTKQDGTWLAYGSPYAGSSKCHKNKSCRVTAIVMLSQDKKCSLRRLSAGQAFRSVYQMMTAYLWDEEFVKKVCDLSLQLVADIPVYHLACTPDRDAVLLLKKELGGTE